MERRLALATAGAVAATLGIGTLCFAALGQTNLLGLSGAAPAAQVVPGATIEQVTKVVVVRSNGEIVVVDSTSAVVPVPLTGDAPNSPAATPTPAVPMVGTIAPSPTAAPTPATTPASKPPPTAPKPVTTTSSAPHTTQPPATAAPTTLRPVTSTTAARPSGVPADWPAGKPIPPMPAGCEQPQLELNGVWNCDD
jgi:hypothetical protein